jgi:hypothetical protein
MHMSIYVYFVALSAYEEAFQKQRCKSKSSRVTHQLFLITDVADSENLNIVELNTLDHPADRPVK